MCGFIINPYATHLDKSPDRKVLQRGHDKSYGLLEMKFPDQYSYTGCKNFQQHSGDTHTLEK